MWFSIKERVRVKRPLGPLNLVPREFHSRRRICRTGLSPIYVGSLCGSRYPPKLGPLNDLPEFDSMARYVKVRKTLRLGLQNGRS